MATQFSFLIERCHLDRSGLVIATVLEVKELIPLRAREIFPSWEIEGEGPGRSGRVVIP